MSKNKRKADNNVTNGDLYEEFLYTHTVWVPLHSLCAVPLCATFILQICSHLAVYSAVARSGACVYITVSLPPIVVAGSELGVNASWWNHELWKCGWPESEWRLWTKFWIMTFNLGCRERWYWKMSSFSVCLRPLHGQTRKCFIGFNVLVFFYFHLLFMSFRVSALPFFIWNGLTFQCLFLHFVMLLVFCVSGSLSSYFTFFFYPPSQSYFFEHISY